MSDTAIIHYTSIAQVRRYWGPIRVGAMGAGGVMNYFKISRWELMRQINSNPNFWDDYSVAYHEAHGCCFVDSNGKV